MRLAGVRSATASRFYGLLLTDNFLYYYRYKSAWFSVIKFRRHGRRLLQQIWGKRFLLQLFYSYNVL
jgi:hypothetical protein